MSDVTRFSPGTILAKPTTVFVAVAGLSGIPYWINPETGRARRGDEVVGGREWLLANSYVVVREGWRNYE